MDDKRKKEILARIERWLDAWPEEEALPPGLDPVVVDAAEPAPDLASLAASVSTSGKDVRDGTKAITALRQDVKSLPGDMRDLTARMSDVLKVPGEVKTLAERVEPVAEMPARVDGLSTKVDSVLERMQAKHVELLDAARAEGRGELLGELHEVHERLAACTHEEKERRLRSSWLGCWVGADKRLATVTRELEVLVARLERILRRAGIDVPPSAGTPSGSAPATAPDSGSSVAEADGGAVNTMRAAFDGGTA